MFLVNIKFGKKNKKKRDFCEDLIEEYIGSLFCNGQLCGEYIIAWTNQILNVHATITHPKAYESRFHSDWGKEKLVNIIKHFGEEPTWVMLDDDLPTRATGYKNLSSLYLFTSAFDWVPSVHRGDNGKSISTVSLPVSSKVREDIYRWERSYRHYDYIWIGCGRLEIPVYKQLANPQSELSIEGRDLCNEIESATGIPTYYYLMRYWGRRQGEEDRLCPSCGSAWYVKGETIETERFWNFHFRCDACRLISHLADSYEDERHARIDEYKKSNLTSK